MAKTWLYGIFGDGSGTTAIDGTISVSQVLSATGGTDKVSLAITGEANGSLNVARKDLPENWKTEHLVTGRTLIALVDGDKVLFAGYLNKINSNLNGSITLVVNGLKDYINRQQVNDTYGAIQTNPNTSTIFTGAGWAALVANALRKCFSNAGVPDGVRPANVLGTISTPNNIHTTAVTYTSLHSNLQTYGEIIEEVNAKLSDYGLEVQYVPRWEDVVTKTRIVWDVIIGEHLNEDKTVHLSIGATTSLAKASAFGVTYSVEKTNTRFLGQSRQGQDGAGADIMSRYKAPGTGLGLPRFDGVFTSPVELPYSDLSDRLTQELEYQSEFSEAFYTAQEDFDSEWIGKLGSRVTFTPIDGADFSEFNLEVRCVSLDFSASFGSVEVGVMVILPRYTVLPRQNKPLDDEKLNSNPAQNNPDANTTPTRPLSAELPGTWNAIGYNNTGQLGIGNLTTSTEFAAVQKGERPEGLEFVEIFAAVGAGFVTNGQPYTEGWTHGITTDGAVYGWGDNIFGQLGVDASVDASRLSVPYLCNLFTTPVKQLVGFYSNNTGETAQITALTIGLATDGLSLTIVGMDGGNKFQQNWTPSEPVKKLEPAAATWTDSTGVKRQTLALLAVKENGKAVAAPYNGDSETPLADADGEDILNATDIGNGWLLSTTGIHYAFDIDTKQYKEFVAGTGITKVVTGLFKESATQKTITLAVYIQNGKLMFINNLTNVPENNSTIKNTLGGYAQPGDLTLTDLTSATNGDSFSLAVVQDDGTLWMQTPSVLLGDKIKTQGWTKYATSSKVEKVAGGRNGSLFVKKLGA